MRGVALDEISGSTKIARRHLEALESENFDSLPGGIFNRGFVRAYARFLGIDEDQAVADYVAASGEETQTEPSFPVEVQDQPEPQLNPRRSSLPLLLALIALVIVLAIFWARNKRQPETSENSPAAATATPTPAATAAVATPSPTPITGTLPASPAPMPALSSAAAGTPTLAASESSRTPTPALERTFSVVVQAKEDAWVTVTADGKLIVSGRTLKAGDRQAVRAARKLVLTTGNAGGIDISFNGKPLGPIGSESERRELTFTPSGLVQ